MPAPPGSSADGHRPRRAGADDHHPRHAGADGRHPRHAGADDRHPRHAGAGDPPPPPRILPTVWRGVRRRCPHCGRGPLFVRWITLHRRCADCGLVYLRNQGDIWFFWIVMDRIPILLGIAAIFFGFRITTWINGLGFFLAVAGPLVATMPQRQGAAVALNYLSRVYFRDPSDVLPDPVDDRVD